MSYEYNRRITTLSAEYDKLAALVTQILARGQLPEGFQALGDASNASRVPDLMHSLSQVAAMNLQSQLRGLPSQPAQGTAPSPGLVGSPSGSTFGAVATPAGTKRPPSEEVSNEGNTRLRTS